MSHKSAEHIELGRRQGDFAAVLRCQPTTSDVETQPFETKGLARLHFRSHRGKRTPTAKRTPHPCEDFAKVKGLRDIVIGADFKANHTINHIVPAGQHDNGNVGMGTKFAGQRQPVFSRKTQIEQNDIHMGFLEPAAHFPTIASEAYPVAFPFEIA
ncbi:hypothetical protein BHMPCIPO_00113 [Ensifer sesbaniae]|nr:hypothetical protein [Ensifer sesbaniae]